MPVQYDQATCGGKWVTIRAFDPQTVCCEESLLVAALRSVGVQLHPAAPFRISQLERPDGTPQIRWQWVLGMKAANPPHYETTTLIKWWHDAAWRAANATHEWAILAAGYRNLALQAGEIRTAIPRIIVRRGKSEAHIPANATPERRQWLLDKLAGRVPMDAAFTQPSTL